MLTYTFQDDARPLYRQLYEAIRGDILAGKLACREKLPSKRALARNLGISTITVENAYDQLMAEGCIYALPRKGYFVAEIKKMQEPVQAPDLTPLRLPPAEPQAQFDFSSSLTDGSHFPFSIWARIMRENISLHEKDLFQMSPCCGIRPLRDAIAGHLASFRGMQADPDQIIVGAGTEYLYSLLVKLLGYDKIYCIENPGYKKLLKIYESSHVRCRCADIDRQGMSADRLRQTGADIVHISPTHHFPTGICMPVSRRYELLAWANETEGRYIIEDDYDSEFRIKGRPLPTLFSIDACGKVIYMNTFSKSLTSTIRISYMVLPPKLAEKYYRELAFYSCTVSTFDQYALAAFIQEGFFEKHINRMRLYYGRKRTAVLAMIRKTIQENEYQILENDSGLHLLLQLNAQCGDRQVKETLARQGIRIETVSDHCLQTAGQFQHQFLINYSCIDLDRLDTALAALRKACGFDQA